MDKSKSILAYSLNYLLSREDYINEDKAFEIKEELRREIKSEFGYDIEELLVYNPTYQGGNNLFPNSEHRKDDKMGRYITPVTDEDYREIENIIKIANDLKHAVDKFCKRGACSGCPLDRIETCNCYKALAASSIEDYKIIPENK